jgi:hypothetical protein
MLKFEGDETKQDWASAVLEHITGREVIALDLAGWKIVPKDDEAAEDEVRPKWPFDSSRTGCPCPDWCEDMYVGER